MSRLIVPWIGRKYTLLDCLTDGMWVELADFKRCSGFVSTLEEDDEVVGTIIYLPGFKPKHVLKNPSGSNVF